MSENMAQLSKEYSDFIKEAYIDPIRTVIVVDDEFPSLDGLIRQEKKIFRQKIRIRIKIKKLFLSNGLIRISKELAKY